MVAVGGMAGRGHRRIVVWLDPGGLPIQASIDTFDLSTGDLASTHVIPCEPFDSTRQIIDALQVASGHQLELPLA